MREDLHGIDAKAPKDYENFLKRIGGTNDWGEPIFRLVLAQRRYQKAAGEWNIWPDHASVSERGGLGILDIHKMKEEGCTVNEANEKLKENLSRKPLRVERGMAEVPKYTCEGWILERWMPAKCYGTVSEWYAVKFEDEPALGPYPERGDYEMIAGPTDHLPTFAILEGVVRKHFHDIEARVANPDQRLRNRLNELEEGRKQRHKQTISTVEDRVKDLAPLMNRISFGAGRVRQELATSAGLSGHYGS